jgi:hypothetical protein
MAYTQPFILVIDNGVKQNSSDVFNILDPDSGGGNTFSVGLSASGLAPVTSWACRTPLEVDTYNALKNMTVTQFKAYVDQLQVLRGRAAVGSITAFKNNLRIYDAGQTFAQVLALEGLKRAEEALKA